MSDNDLMKDLNAVDVSQPESQFQVQCADIRLISSSLKPIKVDDDQDRESRFLFRIEGHVEDDSAYSFLDVQVVSVNNGDGGISSAYELRFLMVGVFKAEGAIEPEALADFARVFTLSILWPYAREYTSDQLRRAGQPFDALPIINPQVVTEKLIEGGLVNIAINSPSSQTAQLD